METDSEPDSSSESSEPTGLLTLGIDCGGTGIKASVMDEAGEMVADPIRIPTPYPLPPDKFVHVLTGIANRLPEFDRVTIGMPGMIRNGVVVSTPHYPTSGGPYTDKDPELVKAWKNWEAQAIFSKELAKPTRVLNDAEVQGAAVIQREGLEVMFTLGTGLGCAVYDNGRLAPHIELSHAPVHDATYDTYIGINQLRELGSKKWSKRLLEVVEGLRPVFLWDHLYVGGGNARRLTAYLGDDVTIVPNVAGITGGVKAWDLAVD